MDRIVNQPLMSPCMIEKQWLIKSKIGNVEDDYEFNPKADSLGEGSYGIVYKAVQKSTRQIRAIKVINKSRVKHQERLKNEIEIMSTLDHPNIIRLYETYEDAKNIYLVIEYCEGGELFDRIAERGYFMESEAVVLFRQLMSAINYCHSRKICHRDLKPENFLFCTKDDNSIIKVIDFGLSKTYGIVPDSPLKQKGVAVNGKTSSSSNTKASNSVSKESNIMKTRAGTPYYIAPEVLDGKYDEKCDIWSAGVTLYIILCGYPPFYGETDKEILSAVKKGEYEYEGEEWDVVSDECKNLIKKMLSKPEMRFNSEMVMASKWMQKNQPMLTQQFKIPLQKAISWNSYPKLKKLALSYIASQLSMQQIQPIVKQFLLIDRDNDGCLTLNELLAGTLNSESLNNQDIIRDTFKSFTSVMPNKITFTDFVALVLDASIYSKENVIKSAFKIFDKNTIGKISPNHLHELFLDNAYYAKKKIDYWTDMVKCCDYKNDGAKKPTEDLTSSSFSDDNNFRLHKSFEFLSPNKSTSKLTTGNTKHMKNSPDYQDRFIPSRVHSNLAIALTAAHDENILPPESDHFSLPNRMRSTIVQAVNQKDLGSQEVSVADIFKTEILGIKPPDTKFQQYETKFENRNILAFSSSQKSNNVLSEMNMSHASIPKDSYPFKQCSIFSLRSDIKTYFNRTARKISKIPFKVLDAPTLKDDFYLNLIDWGQNNEIAVGLGSCVYLWSASTSQVTKLCDVRNSTSEDSFFNDETENVTSVSWDDQGSKLSIGTSSGCVQIWDTVELKKIKEYNNHHRQRVGALAWNKTLLVSGSRDKKILVRDTRSPHPSILKLLGHKQEVCGLKWSPDNQMLASGGNDNNLFIWNQHSTRPVLKFTNHTAAVKALSWSPHQHGLLISGGGSLDRTIRMWNSQLGEQIGCIETGSQVCNLQFSQNRNEFVSTHGYSDNQVIVWSYPDLDKLAVLTGHTHRVLHLAMSPDGDTIATGAGDETLRFWNISTNDGPSGGSVAWQPTPQKQHQNKTQDKKKNLLLLPYKNTIR